MIDGLPKVVTPAKARVQRCMEKLDFGFRRNGEAVEAEDPLVPQYVMCLPYFTLEIARLDLLCRGRPSYRAGFLVPFSYVRIVIQLVNRPVSVLTGVATYPKTSRRKI